MTISESFLEGKWPELLTARRTREKYRLVESPEYSSQNKKDDN